MNYDEKKQFLEDAKELARQLEDVTDEFIEVQIGWIDDDEYHLAGCEIPVTIMLNHPDGWFGGFDTGDWNESIIWDKVNKFVPVKNPYLVLNELIDKAYY